MEHGLVWVSIWLAFNTTPGNIDFKFFVGYVVVRILYIPIAVNGLNLTSCNLDRNLPWNMCIKFIVGYGSVWILYIYFQIAVNRLESFRMRSVINAVDYTAGGC